MFGAIKKQSSEKMSKPAQWVIDLREKQKEEDLQEYNRIKTAILTNSLIMGDISPRVKDLLMKDGILLMPEGHRWTWEFTRIVDS